MYSDMQNHKSLLHYYVEKKHDQGIHPTIKNIADPKACRDENVRCKDIVCIVAGLGFEVERNENKVLSDLSVLS